MVSSTIAATSATVLSFTGTADPNNFLTTASFELREVGGSYTTSNTTTSGLGNNIDGAVGYEVTATVADTYKNWEVRAKGVNTAGTDYGSVLTLDCRNPTGFATYTDGTAYYDGGECKTRRLKKDRTYTKTGCFAYFVAAGAQNDAADTCASYTAACYENGVAYSNTTNACGSCGYFTTSGTTYARKASVVGPCDGTLTVANANGGCREGDAWVEITEPAVIQSGGIDYYRTTHYDTGAFLGYDAGNAGDNCGTNFIELFRFEYCAWNTPFIRFTALGCVRYKN
jgi:hypothetical protein